MSRKKLIIGLSLVALFLISLAVAFFYSEIAPRLAKSRAPYSRNTPQKISLKRYEDDLLDLVEDSPAMRLCSLGTVNYTTFSAPLWQVTIRTGPSPRYRVLLTGGVHGDEPAGVKAAFRFMDHMLQDPESYADFEIDVIPIVNPWGLAHQRRRTLNGYDINRDFVRFEGQESRLIRDFVAGKYYDLVVDLHEDDDAQGFYLYQIANPHFGLARRIIMDLRKEGLPIAQGRWMAFLKSNDGVIQAPLWSLYLAQLARQQSLINWLRLEGNVNAFLLESPEAAPMRDRVQMHLDAVEILLEAMRTGCP